MNKLLDDLRSGVILIPDKIKSIPNSLGSLLISLPDLFLHLIPEVNLNSPRLINEGSSQHINGILILNLGIGDSD